MADNLVLYHGNCQDGFCAAWVAWQHFKDDAEYVAMHHGGVDFGNVVEKSRGKNVFIFDFCFTPVQTFVLQSAAKSLEIHDHHKTAIEAFEKEMKNYSWRSSTVIKFTINNSGAGLAFKRFGKESSNWIVDYVEDRDLWRNSLPHTAEINAYLGTLDYSFEAWENVWTGISPSTAHALGTGSLAYKNSMVRQAVAQAQLVTFMGYRDIPVVNMQYVGISEALNILAKDYKFAVGYSVRGDGKTVVSLRSVGNFDVSLIAKYFGGGGHKNAAGFTVGDLNLTHYIPGVQ